MGAQNIIALLILIGIIAVLAGGQFYKVENWRQVPFYLKMVILVVFILVFTWFIWSRFI